MPNPMSGGSPKEINVLRENGTTINNLSSPGLNIRQPLVVPVINAADCGSSSTNSSPTPPMLRANDSSNLYVKMTSEGSSPAGSDQECAGGGSSSNKIPEHQLNIK